MREFLLHRLRISFLILGVPVTDKNNYTTQYPDNVVGPGSPRYDNAFFEIKYVRTYTTGAAVPLSTASSTSAASSTAMTTASSKAVTTKTLIPATPTANVPAVITNGGGVISTVSIGAMLGWAVVSLLFSLDRL